MSLIKLFRLLQNKFSLELIETSNYKISKRGSFHNMSKNLNVDIEQFVASFALDFKKLKVVTV